MGALAELSRASGVSRAEILKSDVALRGSIFYKHEHNANMALSSSEMVDPTGVYPFIGEFNPDRVWIARICNAMKLPTSPGAVATFYAAAWESGFTCRRMLAAE